MATSSITHAANPTKKFEPNTLVESDQYPVVILVTNMLEDQFEGVVMHDSSDITPDPIGKVVKHSPNNYHIFTGKLTLSNA